MQMPRCARHDSKLEFFNKLLKTQSHPCGSRLAQNRKTGRGYPSSIVRLPIRCQRAVTAVDRATGALLERNNVQITDAIR
jgi:hypothetical protein